MRPDPPALRKEGTMPGPVLDIHHHIGPRDRLTGQYGDFDLTRAIDRHLRDMDEHGIEQACLIATHNSVLSPARSVRQVNELVARACAAKPDRFAAGVGTVDPVIGEAGFAEIRACADELGLAGMAWHPHFQGVSADSPALIRYAAFAADLGLPVFMHMVPGSAQEAPWRVQHLAESVPAAQVICLDAFASFDQAQWILAAGGRVPNLTFELSHLAFGSAVVVRFVQRYGAERLVFGSDFYSDVGPKVPVALPVVRLAALSRPEEDMILGGNARRLLRSAAGT
jgi:predicted TIM-barrel fold metal-dependent hydrolase